MDFLGGLRDKLALPDDTQGRGRMGALDCMTGRWGVGLDGSILNVSEKKTVRPFGQIVHMQVAG